MVVGSGSFGAARIAWTDASSSGPVPIDLLERFGEQQVRRYASLTGVAARKFLAGRSLLADLIAEMTDEPDLTLISTCRRCGGDHGQPRLEGAPIAVSLSYAGNVVAAAAVLHVDASAVGVDIERIPRAGAVGPLSDLAPLFAPAPPPDRETWTLIEAALKADGRGLVVDLFEIEVGDEGSGRVEGARAIRVPGRTGAVDATVIAGPEGFILSAATVPAAGDPR
jgi:4'-phosphopantetheinyl transferase